MIRSKWGIFGALVVLVSMFAIMPSTSAAQENSICVIKFYDVNRNGILDNGDFPLANWPVMVKGISLPITYIKRSEVTAKDGGACFKGLPDGAYFAGEERVPTGWVATTPPGSVVRLPGNSDPVLVYVGNRMILGRPPPPDDLD